MSDLITSMTFVDGENGNLVTVTSESVTMKDGSGNPVTYELPSGMAANNVMRAAQVNLGLFGVVVEYTMIVKEMTKAMVENDFDTSLKVGCLTDSSLLCGNLSLYIYIVGFPLSFAGHGIDCLFGEHLLISWLFLYTIVGDFIKCFLLTELIESTKSL